MKISKSLSFVSVLLCLASGNLSATEIYPVSQAKVMTNAKFDFKVEFDKIYQPNEVSIEINGKKFEETLPGKSVWIPKEEEANASALILRGTEIKKPGKYNVVVKTPD